MKTLIAILSCLRDKKRGAHELIRATWKTTDTENTHTRFFVGIECPVHDNDEVCLEVDDANQTRKVQAIFEWAVRQGYDYVFKCDSDTYVHVPRLLASGFEQYPWSGGFGSLENGPYGGSGYWIQKDLMEKVLRDGLDSRTPRPYDEDRWVGGNLVTFGYKPYLDSRYNSSTGKGPEPTNDIITAHWYARQELYSGPVAPPPVLLSSVDRLNLFKGYFAKAKEI